MYTEIEPTSQDLRKAGRYLLIVSCILCIIKSGCISIKKAEIIGLEVEFSSNIAMYVVLWAAWIYYFVRYIQFFLDDSGPNKLKTRMTDILNNKCRSDIERFVKLLHPDVVDFDPETFNYSKLVKSYNDFRTFSGRVATGGEVTVHFNFEQLREPIISSWISMIATQSVVMDYAFPIVLAIAAFAYCSLGPLINFFF